MICLKALIKIVLLNFKYYCMENHFSADLLRDFETIRILGGQGVADPMAQGSCTNEAPGCGEGEDQGHCTNTIGGCNAQGTMCLVTQQNCSSNCGTNCYCIHVTVKC